MTFFSSGSRFARAVWSSAETVRSGIFAIFATTRSTSRAVIRWWRCASARIRSRAPASSSTSIALSGSCRSLMCFADSSAAARSALGVYSTPWCSS
jgi:hypothetical protein